MFCIREYRYISVLEEQKHDLQRRLFAKTLRRSWPLTSFLANWTNEEHRSWTNDTNDPTRVDVAGQGLKRNIRMKHYCQSYRVLVCSTGLWLPMSFYSTSCRVNCFGLHQCPFIRWPSKPCGGLDNSTPLNIKEYSNQSGFRLTP